MARNFKTIASASLCAATLLVGGWSAPAVAGSDVAITMPEDKNERWRKDAAALVEQLEGAGYTVDLRFANDDVDTQISQVEEMIAGSPGVLVIGAVDGSALSFPLFEAESQNLPVFSYDRLIRDTDAVTYYTSFDNFQVGVLQANSLVEGLTENHGGAKPWRVEIFAGSPADNNAAVFYEGAMSVLQPMIDAGDIEVPSGSVGFESVATEGWNADRARERMTRLIGDHGTDLHGVLSPNDGLAIGIIEAFHSAGADHLAPGWPIITGQDANAENVRLIMDGAQYSTVFKDTRALAAETAKAIVAVLSDGTVEVNDTETYYNGFKTVDSVLLTPDIVTAGQIEEKLLQSGFISGADLGL